MLVQCNLSKPLEIIHTSTYTGSKNRLFIQKDVYLDYPIIRLNFCVDSHKIISNIYYREDAIRVAFAILTVTASRYKRGFDLRKEKLFEFLKESELGLEIRSFNLVTKVDKKGSDLQTLKVFFENQNLKIFGVRGRVYIIEPLKAVQMSLAILHIYSDNLHEKIKILVELGELCK